MLATAHLKLTFHSKMVSSDTWLYIFRNSLELNNHDKFDRDSKGNAFPFYHL